MAGKNNSLLAPEMVSRLSSVVVRARHLVEGTLSGIHKSPHRGSSVEFLEHKRYTPGDDIRNLDWKLLARSDRFYVKQFEDETNLRATLVVDGSASMSYGPEGRTKHRFACVTAAAFAYMLLSQSDAVGLLTQQGSRRLYVPPRADWSHFQAIAAALDELKPEGQNDWLDHLMELGSSLHKRGMFVLFSDLLVDRRQALQALRLLRDRRHEVLLFHVLHPWELEFPFSDPRIFTDPEQGEKQILADPAAVRESYLKRVRELCAFFREESTGLEVDYHLLPSDSRLEEALVEYLARREALM
jgi:uncharacterized protein (DUF58 family)